MKVRIGFGLGARTGAHDQAPFAAVVDELERLRFDSLWLSERISGAAPDPLIGLAVAAGRTARLKLGMSVLVLPGRNPVVLAKELATLDRLSGGRLLPAFGLGVADPREQEAFGVSRSARAGHVNEMVPLLRRLWSETDVAHHGEHFSYDAVTVLPHPLQDPLDVWMGGIAERELTRVGRLADGWLPSFCTPDEVERGIAIVNDVADQADRSIDPEHFGVLVAYRSGPVPPELTAFIERRRPGLDPADLVPTLDELPALLQRFIDIGASKFVVVPLTEPDDWTAHLEGVARLVLPLET